MPPPRWTKDRAARMPPAGACDALAAKVRAKVDAARGRGTACLELAALERRTDEHGRRYLVGQLGVLEVLVVAREGRVLLLLAGPAAEVEAEADALGF